MSKRRNVRFKRRWFVLTMDAIAYYKDSKVHRHFSVLAKNKRLILLFFRAIICLRGASS